MEDQYNLEYDNDKGLYLFKTDNDIGYSISFMEDGRLQDLLGLEEKLYSFSFQNINNTPHFSFDNKISNTIICSLKEVFEKDCSFTFHYSCDNVDGKGFVRNRKFNIWYTKAHVENPLILKIDLQNTYEGTNYFSSLLIHENHPNKDLVIDSYKKGAEDFIEYKLNPTN